MLHRGNELSEYGSIKQNTSNVLSQGWGTCGPLDSELRSFMFKKTLVHILQKKIISLLLIQFCSSLIY